MTYRQALDLLYDNTPVELILTSHETSDYYEFVGGCGGDITRYRVYKATGQIYEK